MRIFNKACVAAAFGMILLVTFGCTPEQSKAHREAYDECMLTDSPYSPTMKNELCREYAKRIAYGWKK